MSNPRKEPDVVNDVTERAKNLWEQGNTRHVVLRTSEGRQLLELPLNWAVVGLFLLFFISGGWLILLVGAVAGIITQMRLEVVRDLGDDDNVVEIMPDDDA